MAKNEQKTFQKTLMLIEEANNLIKSASLQGTLIESYFAQLAAIYLCAELERSVHVEIEESMKRIESENVSSFIKTASKKLLRSYKKTDLANFLGLFGDPVKDKFNQSFKGDDANISIYSDILQTRHNIAHFIKQPTVTLQDVATGVEAYRCIFKNIRKSLEACLENPIKGNQIEDNVTQE